MRSSFTSIRQAVVLLVVSMVNSNSFMKLKDLHVSCAEVQADYQFAVDLPTIREVHVDVVQTRHTALQPSVCGDVAGRR